MVKAATGMEYDIVDCAVVKFIIPPLELPDGTKIKLKDAHMVIPPIRFVINAPDGGQIRAHYHPIESKWEIITDG